MVSCEHIYILIFSLFLGSSKIPSVLMYIGPNQCCGVTVEQLPAGTTGRVLKAQDKETGGYFALKVIAKDQSGNIQSLVQEYEILRKLKVHQNIVDYHNVYRDELSYYIATGFCSGGTMLKRILKTKNFSEMKAAEYVQSILSAVQYMVCLSVCIRYEDYKSNVQSTSDLCLGISIIWALFIVI